MTIQFEKLTATWIPVLLIVLKFEWKCIEPITASSSWIMSFILSFEGPKYHAKFYSACSFPDFNKMNFFFYCLSSSFDSAAITVNFMQKTWIDKINSTLCGYLLSIVFYQIQGRANIIWTFIIKCDHHICNILLQKKLYFTHRCYFSASTVYNTYHINIKHPWANCILCRLYYLLMKTESHKLWKKNMTKAATKWKEHLWIATRQQQQ